MRFCPFCSAENADESAVCASCGRRLPPLPPRRAGTKGQPTGVHLPPRPASPAGTPPPTPRKPPSTPPRMPNAPVIAPASPPPPDATVVSRESAPALPPVPSDEGWGANDSSALAQLRNAIAPGPAAERREAPLPEPRGTGEPGRRKSDSKAPPLPVTTFTRTNGSGPMKPVPTTGSGAVPAPPRPGFDPASPRVTDPSGPRSDAARTVNADGADVPVSVRGKSPSVPPPLHRPHSPSSPPPFDRAKSPTRPPPRPGSSGFGGETLIDPSPAGARAPAAADASSSAVQIAPTRPRATLDVDPPPTRIHRPEALVDRPFSPPKVSPVPMIPEPGLITAARYAYQFGIARWQRRGAIKNLGIEIKQDTEALDQVLGALGRAARGARVEGRVFSAENSAITAAEERASSLLRESGEVDGRKAEENSRFVDVERERNEKLALAERMVEETQRELSHLEAQRRALRDKRKELDRRQKAYLKNADDHERQAGAAPLGDQRQELRRAAEGHRKEAAALEPDKQDLDRRITGLERPIGEATARLDAAKAELDAAKRSLADAREGHTHRLAELDSEQKRKAREVALAEAEIQRRLVTLGTLVNLNRIEDPQFAELYQRIDRIRGAITARTTEIEKLTAEREAYDRGTLVRGLATIGGAFVVLIALIVILRAVL